MRDRGWKNLGEYLRELRKRSDLALVKAPVSAKLEIAEIHRRVIAAGGPALLFEKVENSPFPFVTNLFGTPARAGLAFGERPAELIRRLVELVRRGKAPALSRLWELRSMAHSLRGGGVRTRRRAPILETVQSTPDLGKLPALTCWPEDGGAFLTLPLVLSHDPTTGASNLGMYRMQLHGGSECGMHWQIGKGGGFHFSKAEAQGEDLPVSVFLGGPPALTLAAIAPLPENVPELLLAAVLGGGRIPFTKGSKGEALVAEAEFALSGKVRAGIRRPEGPFGDHYGYYSLEHPFPVFDVEFLYHRKGAVFPATVVGKPRQEDFYIGDRLQELLSPIFPLVMPGVRDLWSYGETGYHSLAAAVVHERYPREAMMSAFRILGEGQLSLTKFLLLVDSPLDLRNFRALLRHILERVSPGRDLYIFSELSMDTLDYTGPELNRGSKGVLLGLGEPRRKLTGRIPFSDLPQGLKKAALFCEGCLVVEAASWEEDPRLPEALVEREELRNWPMLILVDEIKSCLASEAAFLWTVFTRFEPAADLYARPKLERGHVAYSFPILIDARMKPPYPAELFCDEETSAKVSRRWSEYFPSGDVEMGDSDRAHLEKW